MKKTFKDINKEKGIVQITTWDERFYAKPVKNPITGLPEYDFYESSSWISSYYPKGKRFIQWVGEIGFDEAQRRMVEAGVKGSKTHLAAEDILKGLEVKMDGVYPNKNNDGLKEELTVEEYEGIMSLVEWLGTINIEVLASEVTAFNDLHHYAGTVDLICRIDDQVWIIDFKTSPNIWPSHEIQLSSYGYLSFDLKKLGIDKKEWADRKIAILQLGYNRNKIQKYKFTEVEDKFDLFLSTKAIWANECANVKPSQKDYPLFVQAKKLAPKVEKKITTKKGK